MPTSPTLGSPRERNSSSESKQPFANEGVVHSVFNAPPKAHTSTNPLHVHVQENTTVENARLPMHSEHLDSRRSTEDVVSYDGEKQ